MKYLVEQQTIVDIVKILEKLPYIQVYHVLDVVRKLQPVEVKPSPEETSGAK
jgi:hypothetical protein